MRLVQRLGKGLGYINPFGEANAVNGLSETVLGAISRTFEIQYMGASEYEHGVFGKAMANLYEYELVIVPMRTYVRERGKRDVVAYVVCGTHNTYDFFGDGGDMKAEAFALRNIKSIYRRASCDFCKECKRPHGQRPESGPRTEVSRDDWGSFYDAVNKVDKADCYAGMEETIGWIDLGYEDDDTYAWFLSLEDAERFIKLVKEPARV